ncbi:MAG: FtsX-like permease family protein, partial [Gemmatimonadetes bacterium]|nr:FtsX-like permease family protein [Gemmatimonadota bacterium]
PAPGHLTRFRGWRRCCTYYVNARNLTLARADERQRDTAIRTALGASRAQLVRQLVTESLLLSGTGALVGALIASVALRALVATNPTGIPRIGDVKLDAVVLGVAVLLAVATGLAVGVWPAIAASRVNLARAISDGGRASTAGASRMRFRNALTIVQTAGAVVLLVGATLLVRSFDQMSRVDIGFRTDSVLTAQVALPSSSYAGTAEVVGFFEQSVSRIRELPGVTAAGATRLLPLTGTIGDWSITLEGKVRDPSENPNGDWQVVTPGYFEAMGAGLVRGRFFTTADNGNAPLVAVITEAMAETYWPGEDVLDRRFHLGSDDQP